MIKLRSLWYHNVEASTENVMIGWVLGNHFLYRPWMSYTDSFQNIYRSVETEPGILCMEKCTLLLNEIKGPISFTLISTELNNKHLIYLTVIFFITEYEYFCVLVSRKRKKWEDQHALSSSLLSEDKIKMKSTLVAIYKEIMIFVQLVLIN